VRAGSRWPFTFDPDTEDYLNYLPFPFFLAYAAALLTRNAVEAKLIDAIAERLSEAQTYERAAAYAPDAVVIETSTPSFDYDVRLTAELGRLLPKTRIVLCGTHASVFPRQILRDYSFISYILIGEYERTLLDLVRSFQDSAEIAMVHGLAYRDGAKIKVTKQRRAALGLDTLPWPQREGLPLHRYNDGFCGLPVPNVQMMSSRGCPFRCTFCLWPQVIYGNRQYRMRDPGDVVREMEYLVRRYGFKAVYFDDDTFNINRTHVLKICAEIKKRKLAVPWAAMGRSDLMDERLIASLADAGMYAVKYGIESVDRSILRQCKKNLDIERAKEMVKVTRQQGIKTHLTFCVGLPGENKETIEETLRFIDEVRPDSVQCSIATPFPGTEYYEYLKKRSLLASLCWGDYDGNCRCVIKSVVLSQHELQDGKQAIAQRMKVSQSAGGAVAL
jgi:radical SAM superfamily enzyme YgiQ (UPF0313 family)